MVISCKIVNNSMKFNCIHKISVILEKFLLFFNLLQVPDITARFGAGSGPQVVHPCNTICTMYGTDSNFHALMLMLYVSTLMMPEFVCMHSCCDCLCMG